MGVNFDEEALNRWDCSVSVRIRFLKFVVVAYGWKGKENKRKRSNRITSFKSQTNNNNNYFFFFFARGKNGIWCMSLNVSYPNNITWTRVTAFVALRNQHLSLRFQKKILILFTLQAFMNLFSFYQELFSMKPIWTPLVQKKENFATDVTKMCSVLIC